MKLTMSTEKFTKTRFKPFRRSKSLGRRERAPLLKKKKIVRRPDHMFGPEVKMWSILLGLSVIISLLLFPNILILTQPKTYKLGDVADRDIKASHEFLVENKELTEKSRQEALKGVLSVYDFDASAKNIISRIKEVFKAGREHVAELSSAARDSEHVPPPTEKVREGQPVTTDSFKEYFFEIFDISANNKAFETLLKNGFRLEAEEATINLVSQALISGVVSNKMMLMSQGGKGITLHDINTGNETKITDLSRFYDLKSAKDFMKGQRKLLRSSMSSK
ncbi:MAG TPA: hypothetical protein VMW90_05935, partial [Acidobacteriota bacterium]|nr:hypothetical protein [Acidobacteriota bacterium]